MKQLGQDQRPDVP